MKLVSVVMGAYNDGEYVRRSINSIRQQTYPCWELVVVDDASIDNTKDVLSSLCERDKRITIIHNKINMGLANSLNSALAKASGHYVARMDADDIAFPQRLERQVAFLGQHPAIDVVGAGVIEINERENPGRLLRRRETHEEMVKYLFTENPFFHPTVMARKGFFEAMRGYDERLRRAQDYDLWLRGYRHFIYHNLREPLVYYRRDMRPNWKNGIYSALVIFKAIVRDRKPPFYVWYVLRPLIATGLSKVGFRSLTI